VSVQGRNKYVAPIYRALVQSAQWSTANQWLMDNASFYCAITYNSINAIVNPTAVVPQSMRRRSRRFRP
jgi:hypothetical protein